MKESDLVKACLDILEVRGIFAWRNNTGAMKGKHKGKSWFVRFGYPGSSDIFAVHNGRFICIECKVGYNKQSKSQKKFQKDIEEAGAMYFLVYTPEEMMKIATNIKRKEQ